MGGNYAAIWVDYDNDWDTDLYITKCRGGAPYGDARRTNLLYRNNGDGTFTSAGVEANLDDGTRAGPPYLKILITMEILMLLL